MIFLLLGCIGAEGRSNETVEIPQENITKEEPVIEDNTIRHFAGEFSFKYPDNMETEATETFFRGTHNFEGQTYEVLIVSHLDTKNAYGVNADESFKVNPIHAVTDFLEEDIEDDPNEILQHATEYGDVSTYFIVRNAAVAEVPFKLRFPSSQVSYNGYAIDIYIPERSQHVKARILGIDQKKADQIKEDFLLTFRVEKT